MEYGTVNAALEADVSSAKEKFGRLVDEYVIVVTERLCSLDNEMPGLMQRSDMSDHKARILRGLEALDRLVADYRGTAGQAGEPQSRRRRDDPAVGADGKQGSAASA